MKYYLWEQSPYLACGVHHACCSKSSSGLGGGLPPPAWVPLILIILLGIFVVYVLRKEENKDWYI